MYDIFFRFGKLTLFTSSALLVAGILFLLSAIVIQPKPTSPRMIGCPILPELKAEPTLTYKNITHQNIDDLLLKAQFLNKEAIFTLANLYTLNVVSHIMASKQGEVLAVLTTVKGQLNEHEQDELNTLVTQACKQGHFHTLDCNAYKSPSNITTCPNPLIGLDPFGYLKEKPKMSLSKS